MIKIAIVEDEKIYLTQLMEYLKKFETETGHMIKVEHFPDGAEIVEGYQGGFDIILMDIQMKYMDGMTAAEKIREVDTNVILMFITNMTGYAIRGYEVDALDYIVKPVEYFSFAKKLERAIDRIPKKQQEVFSIAVEGGIRKLPVKDILYIESLGHNLRYHMVDGIYENRATMKDTEAALAKYHFYRIGKSYLVNLARVDAVKGNDCVLQQDMLPISRQKKKEFMDTLSKYMMDIS